MKSSFQAVLIAGCMFLFAAHANAQDAPAIPGESDEPKHEAPLIAGPCDKPNLTSQQRADRSDMVFKGAVTDARCECHMGTSNTSYDSADIPCRLSISVNEIIKGLPEASVIALPGNAGDPAIDWGMDKKMCNSFIDKYTKEVLNKTGTYYVTKIKGGYKETPVNGCATP